jgi:DNA-binding response OmpR family regulator
MNHPARILVVDDERDTCANLQDILTDLGYQVDVAYDGPMALTLLDRQPYDVALLDLRMPGMDGLELYRRIRATYPGTVAIIVTAYASGETTAAAQQAGAWHVLSKPVDFTRLLPLVGQAAAQPHVLVVDDDPDLCASLWDLFRERNMRVSLAHDLPAARKQLTSQEHQVVLIDLKLPTGDGCEVFHLVREANPQAATVLITGHRSDLADLIAHVESEGADAVCYKPFDVSELIGTVQRLADRRGAA